ncbi:hypothetical protein [Pantoea ananatis]|uniref:hypothetical protein n=1 Tax=Pantoea ananas TaxID=553 RepID=UPI001B301C8E|nr:hypothetical protein [Pantoea ananatis]
MIFFDITPVFTVKNEFFGVIFRHEYCDFTWFFLVILEVKNCVLHIITTAIMLGEMLCSGTEDGMVDKNIESSKVKQGKASGQRQDLLLLPLDELRFFGVEPRDIGRAHCDVVYGDIADNYTFTCFDKRTHEHDGDMPQKDYEPTNFWLKLLNTDINKEDRSTKEVSTSSRAFSSRRSSGNDVSFAMSMNANRWTYQFRFPLQNDDRRVVKALLNDKKKLFAELQQHYFSLKSNSRSDKKALTLLPMSIFVSQEVSQQESVLSYRQIKEHAAQLNKQLPEVIKKLRHRSAYSSFLGYSKVVMLTDTNFVPYLHIIFYVSVDNLSNWYAHDIGRIWSTISGRRVDIHYYSFTGELPSPPVHLLNNETDNEEKGSYQIFYKDVLLPFPSEDHYKKTDVVDKSVAELTALISKSEERKANKEKYSKPRLIALKKQLKNIMGMADSQINHLDYLARVAKNYSKIPGITSFTQSDKPVYNSQYSNKKYEQRKVREKLYRELKNESFLPSNYDDHLEGFVRKPNSN